MIIIKSRMNDLRNNLYSRFRVFSEFLSILIILFSVLFIIGWVFDILILVSPGADIPTINSNTAFSFLLIGFALLLTQEKRINKYRYPIAVALSVIVIIIGILNLSSYFFSPVSISFPLNEIEGAFQTPTPDRMSIVSILAVMLTSIALIIMDKEKNMEINVFQLLAIISGSLSFFVILGYLYQAGIYLVQDVSAPSFYGASISVLASLAVLSSRPEKGIMKIFTNRRTSGFLARRLITTILIIPSTIGWIRLLGEQSGIYDAGFGVAITVFSTVIILLVITIYSLRSLDRTDLERIKSEKALKLSKNELEQFAFITSHDLQEPLRSIVSYAQLLEMRYKGQLDEDADEFIEYMVTGSKRLKLMIQGLRYYSGIETKGGEFKEVDMNKNFENSMVNLEDAIDELNAEITHDPLPVINADPDQISSLFYNLADNALKFRKKDVRPKIHVSAIKSDDEYIFSVKDNGIGIEEEYFGRIFEVFKRLHAIGDYRGTGIGLAIVSRIIHRHGGDVWVESSLGKGSTFYFTIPV